MFEQISKKQREILNLSEIVKKHKIVVLDGSIRVGKTMFGSYGFDDVMVERVFENNNRKDNRYLIVGYSDTNVKDNVIPYLEEHLRHWKFDFKPTQSGYVAIRGNYVIQIDVVGASDKKSVKAIQSKGTYRAVFVDEAGLVYLDSIAVAMGRYMTYDDGFIIMTTNPEGSKSSPFYKKYIDNEDTYRINFQLTDNPIIDKKQMEFYKKIYTETMYRRKILGQWVVDTGGCYPIQPKQVSNQDYKFDFIFAGIDEAVSNDAITCVYVGVKGDKYYIFNEFYRKENNMIFDNVADDLRKHMNEVSEKYGVQVFASFETNPGVLFNKFYNMSFDKLNKNIKVSKVQKKKEDYRSISAIRERIELTNMMINCDIITIDTKCSHLIEAFENAIWSDKGNRLDDGTSNIDSLDAFEYAIKQDYKEITDICYTKGLND